MPDGRRRDGGLRVVVTTDVGLRGLGGDGRVRRRDRFVVLEAGAFGGDEGGPPAARLARGPVDPDRGPGTRRDVPPAGREGGLAWSLKGAKTIESAGRPWRWRALATVALEQAMLEPGRSRALALAWTAGLLIAPALVAFVAHCEQRRPRAARPHTATLVALLVLFALPFAARRRGWSSPAARAMAEVTLLSALRNLGLGLAAMAHRPAYARLSALVSLFLVTVASPVGGEAGMAVLAAGRRLRGRRHALADARLLEGARHRRRRGPRIAPAPDRGRGLGAGGRRGRSRRSRRSGRRGRPPCWRA